MKKVTLYIAASLDGFIARTDGAIDWLPVPDLAGEDYGYGELLESVDTLLLGRKTYEQVLTLGPWPYEGKRCIVFSATRAGQRDDRVEFVDCDIAACVRELKAEPGEGIIWLVGGAEIIAACLAGGVVDEIILTTVPVLLGEGIRLFPETTWLTRLKLENVHAYPDGLVQQIYLMAAVPVEPQALAFA
ncbi:dihydrofolate reductase family protein [Rariglobus hedericola]|uniref:Dihydrofolate reductase n=1 Tax=Rariglobus hedericola TaxID=2597822 RepID=A0A556QLJ0_9BACT|nr:dihydrofolate reductase family protein [Rariglobus hedericola]TSJ77494.1 dihydrofolate reductase [Rariglobus hedericola]